MRDDTFHTVDEVARRCRVHPLTIRRHIAQGKLKAVRVGRRVRIREDDLGAYLDDRAGANGQARQWKVFGSDDPLFKLIGIGTSSGPTDVSSNKKKYIAEALLASFDRHDEL